MDPLAAVVVFCTYVGTLLWPILTFFGLDPVAHPGWYIIGPPIVGFVALFLGVQLATLYLWRRVTARSR